MRKIMPLLFTIALILAYTPLAQAQGEVQVTDLQINHLFGREIMITAEVQPVSKVDSVKIIIQSQDGAIIASDALEPSLAGSLNYRLDLIEKPVRAFSQLFIWFEIELSSGGTYNTEPTQWLYDDNRFDWLGFQNLALNVFWYQPDAELGQTIFNTAMEGLDRIQSMLDVPVPEGISIYAYTNAVDMQETLMFSGGSSFWIAGHAAPDLDVIVVSLPPGPEQSLEIKRQIPHELVHILLYRKMENGYANLPRWLNEGLASTAELFPNPDYQLLLEKAYERQSLIPIHDLCASFPMDAASFQLSYAEAYAFTHYLQETYGKDKINDLIQTYTRGLSCDQGIQDTFQQPLSELETAWRQAMFNENQILNLWMENLPMALLFGFVFITPVGLMLVNATRQGPNKTKPG